MIANITKLISAVRNSLNDQLLPQLKPNSWQSGNVRSCLALLTYMEDALEKGQNALVVSNDTIQGYFAELVTSELLNENDELKSRLARTLESSQKSDNVDLLNMRNNELKSLLSEIVSKESSFDERAKKMLYDCLRVVAEQEYVIAQRASEMPPF